MGKIQEKLKLLPTNPGVYVMLDKDGTVIYVGKAKNLSNRVRQYFFKGVKTNKVMAMVNLVDDFYYVITKSEIDALSLENNLIKKYKPKYNILLKDDKTYPYLRINLKEPFPYFTITRVVKKDGAKYFGPFMGGVSVKEVLEIIINTFKLRPCKTVINLNKPRKECLNYHIGKCSAPCTGNCDQAEYQQRVERAIDFLNGNDREIKNILTQKMHASAEREDFESALSYRDKIASLDKIYLKRITALSSFIDADVLAYDTDNIHSAINMLIVRKGRTCGSKSFAFSNSSMSASDALGEFITRYYTRGVELPDEIITCDQVDETLYEEYLSGLFKKKVSVVCPKIGVRKQLVDMAKVNANDYLSKNLEKIKHKEDMTVTACKRLQEILGLKKYPKRIECYDISNISGVDKVGSMVVFNDGEPDKQSYRRFKIKTVDGANDYASHQEMMERRLSKLGTDEEERFPIPDLVVIDGGKGQLSAVKEVFDKFGVDIDLISLAERNEEIFTLNSPNPVVLPRSDYSLKVLIRIRDEAHRFAITYHRDLRGKRSLTSLLDGIHGLGKVKIKALREYFKDIYAIINADKQELMKVEGIGEKQAELIIQYFTQENLK